MCHLLFTFIYVYSIIIGFIIINVRYRKNHLQFNSIFIFPLSSLTVLARLSRYVHDLTILVSHRCDVSWRVSLSLSCYSVGHNCSVFHQRHLLEQRSACGLVIVFG